MGLNKPVVHIFFTLYITRNQLFKKMAYNPTESLTAVKQECPQLTNLPKPAKENYSRLKCHLSLVLQIHCLPSSKTTENKKYVLWNAGISPIASKVGHVTLATPPFGVIHHRLYTTSSNGSNRENTKSLAQNRNPRWRTAAILDFQKSDF